MKIVYQWSFSVSIDSTLPEEISFLRCKMIRFQKYFLSLITFSYTLHQLVISLRSIYINKLLLELSSLFAGLHPWASFTNSRTRKQRNTCQTWIRRVMSVITEHCSKHFKRCTEPWKYTTTPLEHYGLQSVLQ